MKKNKYIVFAFIGLELVSLIVAAIWISNYLVQKGYSKNLPAFAVILAFVIWFTSLMVKLKKIKND